MLRESNSHLQTRNYVQIGWKCHFEIYLIKWVFYNRYRLAVNRTYCGHGIGSLFHSAPNVPHYGSNKATGFMKAGHVFTIQPMINAGVHKDITWPDNWTAVTADGQRSAQFEHTLLITENGCEVLTKRLENSPKLEFL